MFFRRVARAVRGRLGCYALSFADKPRNADEICLPRPEDRQFVNEHHLGRCQQIGCPFVFGIGVKGCTRFKSLYSVTNNAPDYLAVYAVNAADIPRSPEWKAQTQKGAWPTQIRPHFTARRNGVYRRTGVFKR